MLRPFGVRNDRLLRNFPESAAKIETTNKTKEKEFDMPRARRVMRRRSIARTAATTAVVAGTAAAVGGAVHHHQNKKYSQEAYDQQQAMQSEAYEQEQYTPPPAAPEEDVITQLERLAALKDQGILTEEEFAAQKAKLLGL
jgi:hypothetical protein